MKRRRHTSLFVFTGLAIAALLYTLVAGNRPLLGLDLQGGVSVVLQPKDPDQTETESVRQAQTIIRNRVDALGVAEPDIVQQGKTIVVQLPGVKDREEALALVGRTAKLDFRPVLSESPLNVPADPNAPATPAPDPNAPPTPAPDPNAPATPAPDPNAPAPNEPVPAEPAPGGPGTTVPTSPATDEQSLGVPAAEGETAAGAQEPVPPPATEPPPGEPGAEPTPTPAPDPNAPVDPSVTIDGTLPGQPGAPVDPTQAGTTTPCTEAAPTEPCTAQSSPDSPAELSYQLGPQPEGGTPGEAVSSADAQLGNGQWAVGVSIKDQFKSRINELFNSCFAGGQGCQALRQGDDGQPHGAVAIVLDGQVVSAPTVNSQNLADQQFQITGSFTKDEAEDLALVLRYGALPVEFQDEVNVQEVSATLGRDSLRAGLIAGLVGLGLVALYMVAYYRLLGVVAILSLGVSSALLWAVISYLGETRGLALTLAGITGIIVSIGVAVDSNVVFYENLKEDMAKGRTLRSTVTGSFDTAWHTIVSADLVSLIGAVLLYLLTVGGVRGFAFYLGLASLLDLLASYFFMRPLVLWMGQSDRFQHRPRLLGLAARPEGEDREVGATAPAPAAAGAYPARSAR